MNTYKNIFAMIEDEATKDRQRLFNYIDGNEDALKRHMTPARLARYEAGKMSREDAVAYAFKRARRDIDKRETEDLETLERVKACADVVAVSVSVEWHRSRMWGYNPVASVTIEDSAGHFERYTDSASGCGYDKESSAVAGALNNSDVIKKMLFDKKEETARAGVSYDAGSTMNKNFIAYGAGYGARPYFEGGVGMTSHIKIFAVCGLPLKVSNHTKNSDFYYFERA